MKTGMKFVSREKMSKRDRAALDRQSRRTWNVNPVCRVKPSAKVYNRKKDKDE